jgi:hypothetical protein
MLSFGAEYFVYQYAIKKLEDEDIRNYNLACDFVRVCNLITHTGGGT